MVATEKEPQDTPVHFEEMKPQSGNVEVEFDPELEKKLVRRIDLHLIPILSLLLLCAFVDR